MPQEPEFDTDDTVFDAVAAGLTHARALLDEYDAVANQLADEPEGAEHDALMSRMNTLESSLDHSDAWNWSTRWLPRCTDRPERRGRRWVACPAA